MNWEPFLALKRELFSEDSCDFLAGGGVKVGVVSLGEETFNGVGVVFNIRIFRFFGGSIFS